MHEKIKKIISDSIAVKNEILSDTALLTRTQQIAAGMVNALKNGGRVYFCGNGGSAADAQHLAAEFSGRFYTDRQALLQKPFTVIPPI